MQAGGAEELSARAAPQLPEQNGLELSIRPPAFSLPGSLEEGEALSESADAASCALAPRPNSPLKQREENGASHPRPSSQLKPDLENGTSAAPHARSPRPEMANGSAAPRPYGALMQDQENGVPVRRALSPMKEDLVNGVAVAQTVEIVTEGAFEQPAPQPDRKAERPRMHGSVIPHDLGLERKTSSALMLHDVHGRSQNGRFFFHAEFFHAMISYRVSTEGDEGNGFAVQLYKEIRARGRKVPKGTCGRWPTFARKPEDFSEEQVKVYLDTMCLKQGEPWEDGRCGSGGFIGGVSSCLVFVPLLSWYSQDQGSIGQLARLDPDTGRDWVDNILLELVISTHLLLTGMGKMRAILPILMGEKDSQGRYGEFPFNNIQMLKDRPSAKTNERAIVLLKKVLPGFTQDQEDQVRSQTIRGVVSEVLRHQASKLSNEGIHSKALSTVAQTVADSIHNIVQEFQRSYAELQNSVQAMQMHRPQGREVKEWLDENRMGFYAELFARHSLDSLEIISKLTPNQIATLEQEVMKHSMNDDVDADIIPVHSRYGKQISFQMAVDKLKKDPRARSLSQRLVYYCDKDTNGFTAFTTSNSVETASANRVSQGFLLIMGSSFITWAIQHLHQDVGIHQYLKKPDENIPIEPRVRRVMLYTSAVRNLIMCVGMYGCLLSHSFGSRLAKRVMLGAMALCGCLAIIRAIAEIVQCNQQGEGTGPYCGYWVPDILAAACYFFAITCAYTAPRIFWLFVISLMLLYTIYYAYLVLQDRVVTKGSWIWYHVGIICFVMSTLIVMIVHYRRRAIQGVFHEMKEASEKYHEIWNNVMAKQNRQVHDLVHTTQRIEDTIAKARKQYSTTFVKRLLSGKKSRFSRVGKLRQTTDDIDELFALAQSVSFDFQDWVAGWCPVGVVIPGPIKKPARALQKVVRSYLRDPGQLTDLVRCTIVVETVEEVQQVLNDILRRSTILDADSLDLLSDGERHAEEVYNLAQSAETFSKHTQSALDLRDLSAGKEQFKDLTAGKETGKEASNSAKNLRGTMRRSFTTRSYCSSTASDGEEPKILRLVDCDNRFDPSYKSISSAGYRHMCIHCEVGWVVHPTLCEFLPVEMWSQVDGVCQLICEIQILLREIFEVKATSGHAHYLHFRNVMIK